MQSFQLNCNMIINDYKPRDQICSDIKATHLMYLFFAGGQPNKTNFKQCGEPIGYRSYLMVHLLSLTSNRLDFRQKQHFFLFSIYLQIEDALFIYTVNYVLVQIYKCGSIVNPRNLNNAKLSTQFIIYNVPSKMYKCDLAMLLRQLNSLTSGA